MSFLARTLTRALPVAAVASLVMSLGTAPAQASVSLTGTAEFVSDGDTVDVHYGGSTHRIRVNGIQAMEMHSYHDDLDEATGECWAKTAARRLEGLIEHRTVKLTARYSSSSSNGRLKRNVYYYANGGWHNVAYVLVGEGLALYQADKVEYTPNRSLRIVADRARKLHKGMWGDSTKCGSGPAQSTPLSVSVRWDAPHDDQTNVNGEYIKVHNGGSSSLSLAGWHVRDSAYRGTYARGYTFPSGARVPAGGSVYVQIGKGSNTSTTFHWGLSDPIFENVTSSPSYMGDGGFLFDPDGDLRAGTTYPCAYSC